MEAEEEGVAQETWERNLSKPVPALGLLKTYEGKKDYYINFYMNSLWILVAIIFSMCIYIALKVSIP